MPPHDERQLTKLVEMSDDDVSNPEAGEVQVPIRRADKGKAKKFEEPILVDEDDVEENGNLNGEDDDNEEPEFVVEAILEHIVDQNGDIQFLIKWDGYESKDDQTWEPEENLIENRLLDEYFEKLGGRDAILDEKKSKSNKKRDRKSNVADKSGAKPNGKKIKKVHPAESTPPASSAKSEWKPPSGSWEEDIQSIDAIEDVDGKPLIYVQWTDGRQSQHDTRSIYRHCPQKMLKFYEKHLQVSPASRASEASIDVVMHRVFKPGGGPLQDQ